MCVAPPLMLLNLCSGGAATEVYQFVEFANGAWPKELSPQHTTFSRSLFKTIRKANSEHHLLLIGKDGKIKNSYPFEIDLNIIFSDIDRMPMRKYEM